MPVVLVATAFRSWQEASSPLSSLSSTTSSGVMEASAKGLAKGEQSQPGLAASGLPGVTSSQETLLLCSRCGADRCAALAFGEVGRCGAAASARARSDALGACRAQCLLAPRPPIIKSVVESCTGAQSALLQSTRTMQLQSHTDQTWLVTDRLV